MKTRILFLLTTFLYSNLYTQNWERTFSNYMDVLPYQLIETYDGGYVLDASIAVGNLMKIGWAIKLDVNGNILWDKKIGNGNNLFLLHGIDKTPDGGLIMVGTTDTLNYVEWDPYLIKLNNCAEVEWCRIYKTDFKTDYGTKIKALPDNTYIMLVYDIQENHNPKPFIYKLSSEGELVWEQMYFSDTLTDSNFGKWLELTSEYDILVTGLCYSPDSGQTQPFWLRPMIFLADTSGEAVFELPWGYNNPFPEPVSGEGFQSVLVNDTILTSISNYHGPNPGFSPCLIKTSMEGVPISFLDFKDTTELGVASTIDAIGDSILFLGLRYKYPDSNALRTIIKTDKQGIIINERIIDTTDLYPIDGLFTTDHKYLMTGFDFVGNKTVAKLWKLNLDLEYDSLYTQPRIYDSLCPYPITSSTLFFPCDITVGVQEPAMNTGKITMTVFPNPAMSAVHIRMPECLQFQLGTQHTKVITTLHQWYQDLVVQVFDLYGRHVYEERVKPGQQTTTIDVSSWSPGLYCITLWYKEHLIATEKIIVH